MSSFVGIKTTPYPLDSGARGSTLLSELSNHPLPRYPEDKLFQNLFPKPVYEVTLSAWLPLVFSLVYYIIAHSANGIVKNNGNVDYTKRPGLVARLLRFLILIHNAGLAIYSGWTFACMLPYVLDFFSQGVKAAGFEGFKLALCSMPTNIPHLGKYAYIFYLSKYYEVFDSIILLLKGKKVSNLQSYHHAGAIICMWIAYRYQSQPVWVFCVFNSFVHTWMYTYYFFAAMRWPFPRAVKRNLTTMQIAQIASGTLLTNLYLVTKLNPDAVLNGYKLNKVSSWYTNNPTQHESLFGYALARSGYSDPNTCLENTGAEIALHVNTMYMFPLLALFFNFFMRSYLQKATSTKDGQVSKAAAIKKS